jgi:hypothetical protein
MYSLEDLKKQNQDISALCDVLSVLIEHKSLHSNPYVCELMSQFREKVWMHLVFEDNTIYAELARHHNPRISEAAREFHDSARQLRKRFSGYVKSWCVPVIDDQRHQQLIAESNAIFSMVQERIRYENDHIFPLIVED